MEIEQIREQTDQPVNRNPRGQTAPLLGTDAQEETLLKQIM